MLVLGIDTSTVATSIALGSEGGPLASVIVSSSQPRHEAVTPALRSILEWAGVSLKQVGGIAVGLGPGLFTSMRVGITMAKTLAQSLAVPIVGLPSLDVLAYPVRYSGRLICAAVDAKRGELFYSFYRPVPGGIGRETDFEAGPPSRLAADLQTRRGDILLVGNGALMYRQELVEAGAHVEFASPSRGYPEAASLVELAVPRLVREEFDRLYDVRPIYVRKADAQIAWDKRRRAG